MKAAPRLLLISADQNLIDTLEAPLQAIGALHISQDQEGASEADLVIIDCAMLDNLGELEWRCPVLLLGAHLGHIKAPRVQSIFKPVKVPILVSQIQTLLRFRRQEASIGPYSFLPAARRLRDAQSQKDIRLTDVETAILSFLRAVNGPVKRDVLLNEVLGYNPAATTHTLETHIYRLRQKIERDPRNPEILLTEPGGYCLSS